jgi:hypothetical protein
VDHSGHRNGKKYTFIRTLQWRIIDLLRLAHYWSALSVAIHSGRTIAHLMRKKRCSSSLRAKYLDTRKAPLSRGHVQRVADHTSNKKQFVDFSKIMLPSDLRQAAISFISLHDHCVTNEMPSTD